MTTAVTATASSVAPLRGRFSRPLRWAQWALLLAPVIILGVQGWGHRWIEDDGFINLHVVQQIMAGNGPVFNAGQRVEAFTSPLWLFMLTLGHILLPLRMEWTAVALGIVCTLAGVALAIAGAAILVRDRRPGELLVPAGAWILLALMPIWYFATSGLEMGLVFCWEGASLYILARWARDRGSMPWWGAVILGLGWLIRPELLVFTMLFAVVVLGGAWRQESWWGRLRFLVALLALPLAYEIFRVGYYASFVPNTAITKEAGMARWSLGWDYLRSSLDPYWFWIPVLIIAVGAYVPAMRRLMRASEWRAVLVVGAFVVGTIVAALYIVRVGGDYLHARLLLPSIFALCAPVAVVPLRRSTMGTLLLIPWALWCGIALRPPGVKFGAFLTNAQHMVTIDQQGWQPGGAQRGWFTSTGFYYDRQRLPYALASGTPDPAIASWGIGVRSYALGPGTYTIDMLGLADPLTSHLQLVRRGMPGHEKPVPAPWLVARYLRSTDVVNPSDFPPGWFVWPMVPPTTGTAFDRQLALARATLHCGAVSSLLETSTRPLTIGTFFSNIGRAFSNDNLRIPPDPAAAQRKFCRAGH